MNHDSNIESHDPSRLEGTNQNAARLERTNQNAARLKKLWTNQVSEF